MEALSKAARLAFAKRMSQELAKEFPSESAKLGVRLTGAVDRGIAMARGFGIVKEPELPDFLRLWFACGFDLERRCPGATQVLSDEKLPPRSRVKLVKAMVT